jgi:hypothetical protein
VKVPGKLEIKSGTKPGDYQLTGKVQFQECSDTICKMPQSLAFAMPIKVEK